jgi:hypothetical protein
LDFNEVLFQKSAVNLVREHGEKTIEVGISNRSGRTLGRTGNMHQAVWVGLTVATHTIKTGPGLRDLRDVSIK